MDLFEKEDKSGYNQSGKIVEALGALRCSYVSAMINEDFKSALEAIRAKLTIISGKVKQIDIDDMDGKIYEVEDKIPFAQDNYYYNGQELSRYPNIKKEVKRLLEKLGRSLEKLEDKYGYGMISQEDPRMAILQR